MKVVDFDEFLTLPAGTVYWIIDYPEEGGDSLKIKERTLAEGTVTNEWCYLVQLLCGSHVVCCTREVDAEQALADGLLSGCSIPIGFDDPFRTEGRGNSASYAVLERHDVLALIERLKRTVGDEPTASTQSETPPEFHGRPSNGPNLTRDELLDNAKCFANAEEFTAHRIAPNRGSLWPDERELCADYVRG